MAVPDSNPLVSIIIPAYNQQGYLPATLASCRTQTYPNLEVIVVDDGSKDGTADVAEAVAREDSRFHVIRSTNRGPGAARNIGLRQSRGEWIKLLDHDDLLASEAIERLVRAAQQASAPIACGVARGFWDHELDAALAEVTAKQAAAPPPQDEQPLRHFDSPYELNIAQSPTFNEILVSRHALMAVDGYDERLLSADELNLLLRLSLHQPRTAAVLLDTPPILLKRYHLDSLAVQTRTQKNVSWLLRSLRYAAEYYLMLPAAAQRDVPPALKRYLFDRLFETLTNAYRHGLATEADAAWEIWQCGGLDKPRISPAYHRLLHDLLPPRRVEAVLHSLRSLRDRLRPSSAQP